MAKQKNGHKHCKQDTDRKSREEKTRKGELLAEKKKDYEPVEAREQWEAGIPRMQMQMFSLLGDSGIYFLWTSTTVSRSKVLLYANSLHRLQQLVLRSWLHFALFSVALSRTNTQLPPASGFLYPSSLSLCITWLLLYSLCWCLEIVDFWVSLVA